jgi:hypothetical protein
MIRALLWAQVVPEEEIPEDFHDPHARSEELAKVSHLRRHPNASRHPVLDVPGDQDKVGGEVILVLAGVVVGCITGGRSRNNCGSRAEEGRGRWDG